MRKTTEAGPRKEAGEVVQEIKVGDLVAHRIEGHNHFREEVAEVISVSVERIWVKLVNSFGETIKKSVHPEKVRLYDGKGLIMAPAPVGKNYGTPRRRAFK